MIENELATRKIKIQPSYAVRFIPDLTKGTGVRSANIVV